METATADPTLRERLWARVTQMNDSDQNWGHHPQSAAGVSGPIVPLIIGAESAALSASTRLMDAGFHVPAIRPPTVSPGTCRLRIALSASHSDEDVDDLLQALRERLD